MVLKTEGAQIRCIPHGSIGLFSNANLAAKGTLVDKNLSKGKNNLYRTKGPQSDALHSSRGARTGSM